MKLKSEGQSIIELVIAVGAMSLLLVSLLSLLAVSMKNSRLAKDRSRATAFAQEGVELMRAFRDADWQDFTAVANNNNYGLDKNWKPGDGVFDTDCGDSDLNIYGFFTRCVQMNLVAGNQVDVVVTVVWTEGQKDYQVSESTQLNLWER